MQQEQDSSCGACWDYERAYTLRITSSETGHAPSYPCQTTLRHENPALHAHQGPAVAHSTEQLSNLHTSSLPMLTGQLTWVACAVCKHRVFRIPTNRLVSSRRKLLLLLSRRASCRAVP